MSDVRRAPFFLGLFLCALFLSCVCWRGVLGAGAKAWAYCALGGELSYKSLERENGAFVFQEVALNEEGVPWLTAGKLTIQVNPWWPFRGSIDVDHPQVILSREKACRMLSGREGKGNSRWALSFHEGRLAWGDGVLPDAEWSFSRREKGHIGELSLAWGKKTIFLDVSKMSGKRKWEGAVSDLPLEWASRLMELAGFGLVTECEGELSGSFHAVWNNHKLEDVSFQAQGDGLGARLGSLALKGDISVQAEMAHGEIDRFRLSVEQGRMFAGEATVSDLSILATFHEAGTKWECKANASMRDGVPLPFEMQGREARLDWVEASWRLGGASGSFSKDKEWVFGWDQVGAVEGTIVQQFVAAIYPQAAFWKMTSGVMSGTLQGPSWKELSVISFEGENLQCGELGGCQHLECRSGMWTLEGGSCPSLEMEHFQGQWDTTSHSLEASGEGPGPWAVTGSLEYRDGRFFTETLDGDIDGFRFQGWGSLEPASDWAFSLQLPSFSGKIPAWLHRFGLPVVQGSVHSLSSGLSMQKTPRHFERRLALHFSDVVTTPQVGGFWAEALSGDLYVTGETYDFVGLQGLALVTVGDKTISQGFKAPRICVSNEESSFDVRLEGLFSNVARLVGVRKGNELRIDAEKSHLLDEPIALSNVLFDEKGLSTALFRVSSHKEGVQAQISYQREGESKGFFSMKEWNYQGIKAPLALQVEYQKGRFHVLECSLGDLKASCQIVIEPKGLRLEEGKVIFGTQAACDFTGSIASFQKAELLLSYGWIEASQITPELKGRFEGKGCINLSSEGVEADLDGVLKNLVCREFSFENKGPLHLFFSSKTGLVVQGLDGRFFQEGIEGHGKADLVHFDPATKQWRAEKVHLHALDADIQGDIEGTLNPLSGAGILQEAFFSYQGATRHIRDVHFFFDLQQGLVEGMFCYKDKWAKATLQMDFDPLKGRLILQDQDEEHSALVIDWLQVKEKGVFIQSIEGAFGGVEASFHAFDAENPSRLIGSVRFDGAQVAGWIPEDVAKAFRQLQMGKGFELKGHLSIDPQALSKTSFQGIFSGKQVDLFGYQFRTLLAQTEINGTSVLIYDLQISDSAGMLKVDDIAMRGNGRDPWTIEIPSLMIRDLRPSLLHAAGEELGPLTPLVVRELTIKNVEGLLDELSTYTATGEVSFINSFKREATVFDLPSNVFGRILGLDLELLIPVTGEFAFDLKKGIFQLHSLKNAFSEANRSEFFLVTQKGFPQMDLDGNLNIQIQMKQFVLFKFTEAFIISLEGTLKHPEFRLQKKHKFFGG